MVLAGAASCRLADAMRSDDGSGVSGERLQPMADIGSCLPTHLHIYIYGIDFLGFAWISCFYWLYLLANFQPTNSFHYGSNS